MFFVRYQSPAGPATGVIEGGRVIALADLVPDAPTDMIAVIEAGQPLIEQVRKALSATEAAGIPTDTARFLAPIERPGKFICLGLNYSEHAKEGGRDVPEYPTLFLRVQSSLLAHGENIVLPRVSDKLDYEAELLIVVGKTARNVSQDEALDYVYGYSAFNDGSIRDYQRRTLQWTSGKNFDATGPFGPAIVTADSVPPGAKGLSIRTRLNGEILQDGNTRDMIFDVARIIADVSEIMTLEPGDCIATGTPAGVGFARTPPIFMKAGDRVEIEIEGFPTLVNGVVAA